MVSMGYDQNTSVTAEGEATLERSLNILKGFVEQIDNDSSAE
jgi:hypothetical protein